jgi:hypothetical protein
MGFDADDREPAARRRHTPGIDMTEPGTSAPPSESSARIGGDLLSAMIAGAWRFAIVSIGAFGLWAFWGRWFYRNVGEAGLYAATALAFLGLAGLLLYPLVEGPRRLARFYRAFVPSFLAYAVAWCAMWFVFGAGLGEWLGSLAGSVVFVLGAGWMFGNRRASAGASVVMFVAHTAGYFLGGYSMSWLMSLRDGGLPDGLTRESLGVLAKLSWGLFYGLGFGAGLGYTFRVCQRRSKPTMDL